MKSLDAKEIMARIPHRFPMLLIDRVIELEPGKRGVGIKCVSINEPYFQGHFAEYPIVPGVLIIESLAQLAAVVFAEEAAGAMPEASGSNASVNADAERETDVTVMTVTPDVAAALTADSPIALSAAEVAATKTEESAALANACTAMKTAVATTPVTSDTSEKTGLTDVWQNRQKRPGYLAQVDMRYRQPVMPGDVMQLEVNLIKKMGRTAKVKAEARVDGKIVAQGEMTFA